MLSSRATVNVVDESMKQYFNCVKSCNRGPERRSEFLSFLVEGKKIGYIHPRFAEHLRKFPETFNFSDKQVIELHERLKSPEERTTAVDEVLQKLRDNSGLIPGWRNEKYPVVLTFDSPPFFSLERAAVPFFGAKAYGVHMNGFVTSRGIRRLWVAKRSRSKQTYPGFLDHLVAGGQPVGLSCDQNIVKECEEEAGISKLLAEKAIPVGAVSYEDINGEAYKRDVLFCYDLELPENFEPVNADGEVESFRLESMPDVVHSLPDYKPNCTLVVIDFLFRHGYIKPDQEGYLQLLQGLRNGECF